MSKSGSDTGHPALVLWDVDHTLIESGGVSKEVYAAAFERLTDTALRHPPETGGRTDHEILRGMLVAHQLNPLDYGTADYSLMLAAAGAEKKDRLRERGYALPGAVAALEALRDTSGVVQSVLTGNIKANAFVKLSAFGLDRYIDWEVGGFGSDDTVRANLVGVAQRRAEEKYGVQKGRWATVLIGDTPRDVEAGVRGGAHVLGVATGETSEAQLTSAGADEVLPGLDDTAAVVDAVRRLGRRGTRVKLPSL